MTDTGIAKLPGLPALRTDDVALQRWAQAVAEHLEVRAGARGNPAERGVTQRDLLEATRGLDMLRSDKSTTARAGEVILKLGGGMTVAVAIDAFVKSILDSPLYKSLMQRVDDLSRFDDVPEEVRKILLVSIAEEAARRGADIVRVEKKIQTSVQSLAYTIEEVTAAVAGAAAGVRETRYAFATANLASAGQVLQVQARLDKFAGGGPGVATIEQKFSTVASNVTGLSAEYTVKVSANGIFGGFGISAYLPADPTKPGYSMFLVAADKFGIVFPGNVGGPDVRRIPFGIDANGIYMSSDVYIRGNMRVDTNGSRLSDGLRGSLNIGIFSGLWNSTEASNAIYQALGRGAIAPNNFHLVIGDTVTITSNDTGVGVTKYWMGSDWTIPGVVINGDMLVDGGVSARKINTNGLTIRDTSGKLILGSGTGLSADYFNNLTYNLVNGVKPPADADKTSNNVAAGIVGQGFMATQNRAFFNRDVVFPDGSTMFVSDIVSKLSKINSGTIGTFIDGLAVTNAYIGNAAIASANIQDLSVGTLKIGDSAVTVPLAATGVYVATVSVNIPANAPTTFHLIGTFTQGTGRASLVVRIKVNGVSVTAEAPNTATTGAMAYSVPAATGAMTFSIEADNYTGDMRCSILALGVKK